MAEKTGTTSTANGNSDLESQLAAIEAEEAAERTEELKKEQLRKIERFNLKKRFEKELNGKEREAFLIVNTAGGYVVVRKGESVLYQALEKASAEDRSNFTSPVFERYASAHVVYPDKEKFAAIMSNWPGAISDIVMASSYLHGVRVGDQTKK